MAAPSISGDYSSLKRQRFPSDDEDDEDFLLDHAILEEEDDDSFNTSSDDDDDDDDDDDEDEDEDEEEESEAHVTGTRMATIGNDLEDAITGAQSGRFVSSSPISKSPQSVKLQSSDILDCPTCCEPLKRPIYQCSNGHLACSSCCTKLNKRCSFCKSHIGGIRCRAMEKIIEATIVPCQNAIFGCKQTTIYGDQSIHEKHCVFIRCTCPLPNCNYIGSYTDLKIHVRAAHTWDGDNLTPFVFNSPLIFGLNLGKKKMAVFQEENEGDLIVVRALKGLHGVYVTVSCIAPMTPGICNFSCSLAKLNEFSTLRLGLMVKKIQKVREQEHPQDEFMLIPSYMMNNEFWKMQICIGRGYKYVHI